VPRAIRLKDAPAAPSARRADVLHVRTAREEREDMARDVREGLSAALPSLPSKYFYDRAGSELFDRITALPEYYPTRTEESILGAAADEIARAADARELVELGSGLGGKTRMLLDALDRRGRLSSCVLLDVDAGALGRSIDALRARRPGMAARGIAGDFLRDLGWIGRPRARRLVAFLGGTIGNIEPPLVPAFFASAAAVLAPGDTFLVGLDLVKDVATVEAAYNDGEGVTAEFNRNILRVINTRLGADFEPEAFAHVAFYSAAGDWIEMRLRATRRMRVRVPAAAVARTFAAGDELRTEISCKYTRARLEALLPPAFAAEAWWTDARRWFALALLRRR
jgi:L-histidine N-alpha-methyltransferase